MRAEVRSGAGKELVGTWRLVSFELRSPDGTVSYPFGEDATGYLFYNDQGYMSAAFMGADRARPDSDDLAEVAKGVNFDAFNAYCGPYEVKDDRVVHHVEVASLPQFTGTDQERVFRVDGDQLVLETVPLQISSEAPVGLLVWQRA